MNLHQALFVQILRNSSYRTVDHAVRGLDAIAKAACDPKYYKHSGLIPFRSKEHFAAVALFAHCTQMPRKRKPNVLNPFYWLSFVRIAYSKQPLVIALRDAIRDVVPNTFPKFMLGLSVYVVNQEEQDNQ